jgi:hypothetical protein
MSVCCTSHWSLNASASRILLFTLPHGTEKTSPAHSIMSVVMQVHLTISGQLTYIHILLKVLIMAGCCISMTSVSSSLDKFPLYISVPTVTHVSPYPHANLQNPVSIVCSREGTVQAPYKKMYDLPVQRSAC